MDCGYACERINRYLDGELGYLEVAELQGHLSFCPQCAAELTLTGEVRGALAAWGRLELAPPGGFAERVAAAAASESAAGAVGGALRRLDEALGHARLPGGRTVPVKNIIGAGLAAAAIVIQIGRRSARRARELETP